MDSSMQGPLNKKVKFGLATKSQCIPSKQNISKMILAPVENVSSAFSICQLRHESSDKNKTRLNKREVKNSNVCNQGDIVLNFERKASSTPLEAATHFGPKSIYTKKDRDKEETVYMERDIDLSETYGWNFVAGEEILGEGTYGRVYKMFHKCTGEIRAFKRTFIDARGFPSWLMREISLLRCLDHPNIIRLLQVFIGPERVYLSFPFVSGGTLMDLLHKCYNNGMPIPVVKLVARQIFEAIAHCHKHRVIHRDLKPENVLCEYDSAGNLQRTILADFGLARSIRWPSQTLSPEVITLNYRPIELLLGMPHYTSAVDIWSAGCILLELLIGPRSFREVFFGKDNLNEFAAIMRLFLRFGYPTKEEWPAFHTLPYASAVLPKITPDKDAFLEISQLRTDLDEHVLDILRRTLVLNPDNRISAATVEQHIWFNQNCHTE
ncbi:hypothetical protein IE077_000271 [Cardiosporidium cionae]|uniref:Cyclin-dependent kinase 2 homolog n=1 Tax=Cardiosporidium cionae TaxID=476202 RepID=A0ABQ7JBV1_9APIC|nr:hypothetical protein IE077_000271 [Cardiosporidium cionae]|eukprot:KAF8821492.1 hypothetical protein IE077_000271 [Cardiosporidium cionae]